MLIGITGGIGSGKSYVSSIFAQNGFALYNSDLAAKRLMSEDEGLVRSIKELLGDVYTDGKYDPMKSMDDVLGNPMILNKLEILVESVLKDDFNKFLDIHTDILIESAILLSSNFTDFALACDVRLLVIAPIDTRIERIKKRDPQRTDKQIKRLLDMQMKDDVMFMSCDYVLLNDGANDIETEVIDLINKFKQIQNEDV